MKAGADLEERIRFLARVSGKEARHLQTTDERLFNGALQPSDLDAIEQNENLAERLDAFVSRFGRLQDTLGDKLLPALLRLLGEHAGPVVDNLDKAERFGWVESTEQWLAMRQLRNQMVHEYIEDPVALCDALNAGHDFVPTLLGTAQRLTAEANTRLGQRK